MGSQKIVIVDDDEGILRVVEKTLSQEGFEVISANTGQQGIMKIKKEMPDLVLMDIILPDFDGSEVVRRMQAIPAAEGIPVIFLSSIVDQMNGEQPNVKVGEMVYDAIPKPFSRQQLIEKVKKALGLS